MDNKLKMNLPKAIILIMGLLVVAFLNDQSIGSDSVLEILSHGPNYNYGTERFQMIYWIYIIAFAISVVASFLGRYDISAITGPVAFVAVLIIIFNGQNIGFIDFIASAVVAFLANAELIEVKRKSKQDD